MLNRNLPSRADTVPETRLTVSHNLVESFVLKDVEKQFSNLPQKKQSFVSKSDVIAYALNRLPAIYATTKEGLRRQTAHIETELMAQVHEVVRQGFAAVSVDPFRFSEPLYHCDHHDAEKALDELKIVLGNPAIAWNNVAEIVSTTMNSLRQMSRKQSTKYDWTPVAKRDYNNL